MIPSLSIGPRRLLNDCNHSATAIFWRSAIDTCEHAFLAGHSLAASAASGKQISVARKRLTRLQCSRNWDTRAFGKRHNHYVVVSNSRCTTSAGGCGGPGDNSDGTVRRLGGRQRRRQKTTARATTAAVAACGVGGGPPIGESTPSVGWSV